MTAWVDELKKDETDENANYIKAIKGNKSKASNNFFMMFSPEAVKETLEGKINPINPYGIQPFYINSRYDNAWSKMCEQFPDDVKNAIEFRTKSYIQSGVMDSSHNKSLNKLALYLIEKGNIPASFICR